MNVYALICTMMSLCFVHYLDRPALVHSLLKYKYICASSKNDDKKDIPMTGSKDSQKEEEEKKAPPEKKKPLEVQICPSHAHSTHSFPLTLCRVH